jgi:hypothetical protein
VPIYTVDIVARLLHKAVSFDGLLTRVWGGGKARGGEGGWRVEGGKGGGCGKQKEGAERKKIILSGRQNAKHAGLISGPILPKMAGKEG